MEAFFYALYINFHSLNKSEAKKKKKKAKKKKKKPPTKQIKKKKKKKKKNQETPRINKNNTPIPQITPLNTSKKQTNKHPKP